MVFNEARETIHSQQTISFSFFVDKLQIIFNNFVYQWKSHQTASNSKKYCRKESNKAISNLDELKCDSNQITEWISPIEWIPRDEKWKLEIQEQKILVNIFAIFTKTAVTSQTHHFQRLW